MINPDDLAIAREWAEHHSHTELVLDAAAVRVIQALPDRVIDADEVHKLVEQWENDLMDASDREPYWQGHDAATIQNAEELRALLPTPPRKPAMIKRGATAWHDELGEVTILSNKPNRGAGLAAVTDLVRVAADWDEGDDGSQVATVNASSLTAPDEGLVDSGAPETNNDSADDEEVDDSPEFDKTRKYRDRRGGTWEWDNDEHAWRRDFDGPMGETIYLDNLTDFSEYGPYTVVDESVPPTRDFPQGAHYDSEGNATEPHQVPAGEAWLVQTRYHDEPVPAFKRKSGTWVFIDRRGLSTWDEDRNIELIAPLVPKPEPRVLTTLEDYQDAPIGIIVRADDPDPHFSAWKKRHGDLWEATAGYKQDNDEMSDVARMVIWAPEEAEK